MRRTLSAITTVSLLAALLSATGCFKMGRHQLVGGNTPSVPPVDGGGGSDPPPPTDAGNGGDPGAGGGTGGGGGGGGGGGETQPPVPEPATIALLGSGLAGLALMRRRKRTQR